MSEKEVKDTQPKKQTVADIELEIKALELESKRLEVLEKTANLQDLKERLEERQLKREGLGQRSKINAATLAQTVEIEHKRQTRCTHKKGGNGLPDFVAGNGQSPQYAVLKHIMLNGDTWVRCMRCGKTWKPPIEIDFATKEGYIGNLMEYQAAVNFPTNNATSSSYMFKYSDGGAYSREVLRHTTLR